MVTTTRKLIYTIIIGLGLVANASAQSANESTTVAVGQAIINSTCSPYNVPANIIAKAYAPAILPVGLTVDASGNLHGAPSLSGSVQNAYISESVAKNLGITAQCNVPGYTLSANGGVTWGSTQNTAYSISFTIGADSVGNIVITYSITYPVVVNGNVVMVTLPGCQATTTLTIAAIKVMQTPASASPVTPVKLSSSDRTGLANLAGFTYTGSSYKGAQTYVWMGNLSILYYFFDDFATSGKTKRES